VTRPRCCPAAPAENERKQAAVSGAAMSTLLGRTAGERSACESALILASGVVGLPSASASHIGTGVYRCCSTIKLVMQRVRMMFGRNVTAAV
jgi:hypothetical protein